MTFINDVPLFSEQIQHIDKALDYIHNISYYPCERQIPLEQVGAFGKVRAVTHYLATKYKKGGISLKEFPSSQLAKLQVAFSYWGEIPNEIFHYTGFNTITKILLRDGISLRMTRAEDFDDPHEGRSTIEVFYDLALERLLQDCVIDASIYRTLCEVEVPKQQLFLLNEISLQGHPITPVKSFTYNAYVACFSTEENDPYMVKEYIKNECHKGYCISLSSLNLKENMITYNTPGVHSQFAPVLYGGQIIDKLYNYIDNIIQITGTAPDVIENLVRPLILDALSKLRFFVKLNRYSIEKEVRLVLMIPEKSVSSDQPPFIEQCENKRRFIQPIFPKNPFFHFTATNSVPTEEDKEIRGIIAGRGYPIR